MFRPKKKETNQSGIFRSSSSKTSVIRISRTNSENTSGGASGSGSAIPPIPNVPSSSGPYLQPPNSMNSNSQSQGSKSKTRIVSVTGSPLARKKSTLSSVRASHSPSHAQRLQAAASSSRLGGRPLTATVASSVASSLPSNMNMNLGVGVGGGHVFPNVLESMDPSNSASFGASTKTKAKSTPLTTSSSTTSLNNKAPPVQKQSTSSRPSLNLTLPNNNVTSSSRSLSNYTTTNNTTTTPHHLLRKKSQFPQKSKKEEKQQRRTLKPKHYSIRDAHSVESVGELVCKISPLGQLQLAQPNQASSPPPTTERNNEWLFCMRVARFECMGQSSTSSDMVVPNTITGTTPLVGEEYSLAGATMGEGVAGSSTALELGATSDRKKKHNMSVTLPNSKKRNKLRYICITRATTHPLVRSNHKEPTVFVKGQEEDGEEHVDEAKEEEESSSEEEDDGNDSDGYDTLYNPDPVLVEEDLRRGGKHKSSNATHSSTSKRRPKSADDESITRPLGEEVSSFPTLVCLVLQSDGTKPDIRHSLPLDQLNFLSANRNDSVVRLGFATGHTLDIVCDVESKASTPTVTNGVSGGPVVSYPKERLLWSLLQIHAILCTSVVERKGLKSLEASSVGNGAVGRTLSHGNVVSTQGTTSWSLPTITIQNVDRAELQYVSTVNGFLGQSPVLCALLDRQRNLGSRDKAGTTKGTRGSKSVEGDLEGDESLLAAKNASSRGRGEDMNGLAYDMIMGNFSTLLFLTEEEKLDTEEVLNSTTWQAGALAASEAIDPALSQSIPEGDDITSAEMLTQILQKRMRDLEAETCRRLIAWEDEKYYSATGYVPKRRDTMEALSLSNLFETLDSLDKELDNMEEWLEDKSSAIKPLTDDCADIEEENRQLEQQRKSYETLGNELNRLLSGLEVPSNIEDILKNPGSKMVYTRSGNIDLEESEDGVEDIYQAGRSLKEAFDKVREEGGVHLRAINERVEGLSFLANSFCEKIKKIIIAVMERTVFEVVGEVEARDNTHTTIAKTIRNTQRQFQSSVLKYIKLIEVIALLKPDVLPSIREAYSDLVAEGILSKKRMKAYFTSLPGKSTTDLTKVTFDLWEYDPVALRASSNPERMPLVQAKDIEASLSEILPVIAREAYFTAALFGLSSRQLSGRERKKNFDAAKRSVDHSSQYFKYYMSRICGIASDVDAEGKKVNADPMLSLVASILLNESMEKYIDRQKKGGDHSLSLAYVRSTILELRKKVDKQWVQWVETQIKWVNTHPGVPLNGKRAGILTSFARFPSYLDHVLLCCRVGQREHTPNLSKIKVVAYYLQKIAGALFTSLNECADRETTDQQYAANVMKMENSYFFTQSIKHRGHELADLFQKQITAASATCKQSTDSYLGFMIKREFKPLHTLFANISRIRREVGDADVPIHVPRSTFERSLTKECNKEVLKEKIGAIYFRMEKHLSEAGGLLPVAWKALVKVLYEWFGRWEKLSDQCYRLSLDPSAADVVRIAKHAAGIGAKKIREQSTNKGLPTSGR